MSDILLGLAILFGPIVFLAYRYQSRLNEVSKREQEETHRKKQREEEEALRKQQIFESNQRLIKQNLLHYVEDSTGIIKELPIDIYNAEQALDKAESEYKDGAFAPFWDAIENATRSLAHFNLRINRILEYSNRYKDEINILNSEPPHFNIEINTFPDATSTTNRIQSIVRLAQKNFQFATIYEQRKTNQILVAGFSSLGQALSEMGSLIETSMVSLSSSVYELSSTYDKNSQKLINGVDSVRDKLESDAAERRAYERKELKILDNIQRGNKPLL